MQTLAGRVRGELAAAGLPVRVVELDDEIVDTHGLLARETGTSHGGIALIRPDSHLSTSLATSDAHALVGAARRALGHKELA